MKAARRAWFDLRRLSRDKFRTPLSIAFAFVATHNHFALDRGGRVFKQSAPIIKLPPGATDEEHFALLGYLNSSVACFWMKQVCFRKHSASNKDHPDEERDRYEFATTALADLPLPAGLLADEGLVAAARRCVDLAAARQHLRRDLSLASAMGDPRRAFENFWRVSDELREQMIAVQEEIDWHVYAVFGLVEPSCGGIIDTDGLVCPRGERASERVTPRRTYVRERSRDLSLAEAEVPPRQNLTAILMPLVERRSRAIRSDANLALLERPLFKRLWRDTDENVDEYAYRRATEFEIASQHVANVLENVIRTSLEIRPGRAICHRESRDLEPAASFLSRDDRWLDAAVDVLLRESVPFLAAQRHTDPGLEKRALWEDCWAHQRDVDLGRPVSESPVPPKYDPSDYRDAAFWRLRGKLDVPKERFIAYPGCASDEDGSPVYGWAGWNHVQQAQALAALYQKRKTDEGWGADRLVPMLAGLDELVPWVIQWHNDPSEEFAGLRLGDYFRDFVAGECQALGVTLEQVRGWRPEARGSAGRAKKSAAAAAKVVTEAAVDATATGAEGAPKRRGRPKKAASSVPDEPGEEP
jgi:hypothetical protein